MDKTEQPISARNNRRSVKASTTLSRKYAKRPNMRSQKTGSEQKIQHFSRQETFEEAVSLGQMEDLVMEEFMSSEQESFRSSRKAKAQKESESQSVDVMVKRQKVEPAPKVERVTVRQISQTVKRQQRWAESASDEAVIPVTVHPIQVTASRKMAERASQVQRLNTQKKVSAKELKEQAIRKALASANRVSQQESKQKAQKPVSMTRTIAASKVNKKQRTKRTMHFGAGRVMLALSCATAAVAAIVYFVNLNMPDISLRVAAMQTGMDPSYPNYVPRNYNVSGITSKEGEIKIDFINNVDNKKFSLVEEKSSWDTNALLNNFVKEEYGEDYTVVKEQGLTIYINNSNATWVNGGNVYKIQATNGTLTNKQIKSIAVSL